MYYNLREINGKSIYIVENHHEVLEVWAEYRNNVEKAPILFSLDHHTDTHSAFLHYCYDHDKDICRDEIANELIESINYRNQESIINVIKKLRNDEHIDTAIKADIINKAFLVTYMESRDIPLSFEEQGYLSNFLERLIKQIKLDEPTRPFTYPDSQLFVIGNLCAVGCNRGPHNDDCKIPHYNQAIETVFLDDKLNIMNEMVPGVINQSQIVTDYILDIDLDYFHTIKSVSPEDPLTFYSLIRNASIITIATEPFYVNQWKEFDSNINSETLLEQVIRHITKATK